MFFLLALAYRIFRNPFGAWTLVSVTVVVVATALLKGVLFVAAPVVLRPDVLRGFFQLAFFAFIPLSVFVSLSEWRWRDLTGERHRLFFWPLRRAVLYFCCWMLVLLALFGFNELVFPRV